MGTPAPIHLAPLRCSRTWFNPRHPGSPKLRMGAWKLHDLSLVFQSYLGFVGVWIPVHTSWEGLLGVLSHLQTQGMTGGFWKTRVCVSFRWLDTPRFDRLKSRFSKAIFGGFFGFPASIFHLLYQTFSRPLPLACCRVGHHIPYIQKTPYPGTPKNQF